MTICRNTDRHIPVLTTETDRHIPVLITETDSADLMNPHSKVTAMSQQSHIL